MTVAERLKTARERKGLTQRQMAARVGVTQPTIQVWESGEHAPRARLLRKVAEAYGLKPADLIPEVA